jgi:anti-sigma factor RsiW
MMWVKDIKCREAVNLVSDYLEGALGGRDRRRLEHHLAGCDACTAYLAQMREIIALTGQVSPEDLSNDALDALMDVFDHYQHGRGSGGADPV